MKSNALLDLGRLDDVQLAGLVATGDGDAMRLIMQRNNQRLFRAAWGVLRNRTDAEDAVQSAYLRAFASIERFEGRSSLSTWLTRIAINEALGRQRAARRRARNLGEVVDLDAYREKVSGTASPDLLPDGALAREQIRQLLETAIARLPEPFRLAFMLREVEGLSVDETAETLGIASNTVKTRHLRARRRLQEELAPELKSALIGTFPFARPPRYTR